MLVDLARLPVFPQQTAQHPLSPHPQNLGRHTRLRGTLSLTGTRVTALALGGKELLGASSRVDGGGLDDDTAVLDELLYVRAGVGIPDFRLFIWVEPDFSLADPCDGCGEPLLRAKVDHLVVYKQ